MHDYRPVYFGVNMRAVTQKNYQKDPHYQRVVRAVNEILVAGRFVAPVDLFVKMDLLKPEKLEDWRFGRIPYLERVITCNLSKAKPSQRFV